MAALLCQAQRASTQRGRHSQVGTLLTYAMDLFIGLHYQFAQNQLFE